MATTVRTVLVSCGLQLSAPGHNAQPRQSSALALHQHGRVLPSSTYFISAPPPLLCATDS